MVKKTKPVLHDPVIISRVQQYLEENVDKTYVDVAVMAKELQARWPEYSRRKTVPFRQLVEQAYKTVLHSYGLDSNPSSEDDGSDVEVMSNRPNQMSDTLNNLYGGKKPGSSSNNDDPIDISSDESDDDKERESEQAPEEQTQRTKADTVIENGTTRAKKRKLDEINEKSVGSAPKARKYKKEVIPKTSTVTFADIGGMERTLKQLCELLMHIKHPEIYQHIGLPPPRGFLLHGAPGTGKTLLSHAIAGQLSVPLLEVPATELIAGVSGESEERIRDVFDQAAALAPCVLFLDEIDAISSNRINASKDMERRIVAQLINSLDGLGQRQNGNQVLVIGATNRSDSLDPALRRVGRFDQEISIGIPDRQARKEILQIICKNLKLDIFDFDQLAALTPGYVGADLLALATRAASTAVKRIVKSKEEELVQVEQITEDDEVSKDMEVDQILDGIVGEKEAPKANGDTVEIIDDDVEAMVDESVEIVEPEKTNVKEPETEKVVAEVSAPKDVEVEEAESVAKMVAELSEENAKGNEVEPMETDEPVEPTVPAVESSEPAPTEEKVEKIEEKQPEDKEKVATEKEVEAKQVAEPIVPTEPTEKVEEKTVSEAPVEKTETSAEEKPVEDLLAEIDEAAMEKPEKENIPELMDELVQNIQESVVEPIIHEPVTPKILEAVSLSDTDMAHFAPELPKVTTKVVINPLTLNDMLSWLNSGTPPLSQLELQGFKITLQDFLEALKLVQPSAKREGFITVPDVTWDDIGSLQDIREELKLAILAPVKYPERLKILGLSAPSGVLLCGPPGCGKTLLAKAVANEAGINFISVKGPELLNMYVGESERAVRQCFQRARNSAPCVIFFDEFDSLCPRRSDSGENTAGQRVVNQLLTEMDGIEDRQGVFLMAATNRPDIVDPAVLRPGRFDKILYVGLPKLQDRSDILNALTRNGTKPPMSNDVDMIEIAEATDGFTGADLAGLIRQASLYALKSSIASEDISFDELKVHNEHLLTALRNVKPSVSTEDKVHYDKLKAKYTQQSTA